MMQRVIALVVAVAFVKLGTPLLFAYYLGSQWNGTDRGALAVAAGLTIYIYGVAIFALWHAISPLRNGGWILVGLCSPAALWISAAIVAAVTVWISNEVKDRRRLAAAATTWEEWTTPTRAYGVPVLVGERWLISTSTGLFESNDVAGTWTPVSDQFEKRPVEDWEQLGSSLFASARGGLFRSDDGGRSWRQLGVPMVARRSDTVTWTEKGEPRSAQIAELTSDGTDLYLRTHGDVFRSADLGESWILVFRPDRSTLEGRSFLVSGDVLLVGTFVGGLLRSRDRGASWTRQAGMPHPNVTALARDGRAIYAIGYANRRKPGPAAEVLRSLDEGDTWTPVTRGLRGEPKDFVGTVGSAMILLTGHGAFSIGRGDTAWSPLPLPGHVVYSVPNQVGQEFGVSGGRLLQLQADQKLYHFRGR